MIRVSAGTAACLGLSSNRMDAYPTTAYLLSGKQCLMKCSFCPQRAGGNNVLNRLGRINWPEYSWDEVAKKLVHAEAEGIKRICLQSVRHTDGIETLVRIVDRLKSSSDLPLSVSAWIGDEREAAALIDAGVERISVSIDVINPETYKEIKGGSLQNRLDLLFSCAGKVPGKMSTHLICGLGESEVEALTLIDKLQQAGVAIALFAFVPLRGTAMEGKEAPPVDFYRRIQAGHYLFREKVVEMDSFKFEQGRLVSFGLPEKDLINSLSDGTAFQTSGCPHCNRPYYNERPGGVIYNYHRTLNKQESEKVLAELLGSLKAGY